MTSPLTLFAIKAPGVDVHFAEMLTSPSISFIIPFYVKEEEKEFTDGFLNVNRHPPHLRPPPPAMLYTRVSAKCSLFTGIVYIVRGVCNINLVLISDSLRGGKREREKCPA